MGTSVNRRLTRYSILELSRSLAFQHHAMHDPQLCQVIIRFGAVHGTPVVPNDEIAVAPLMAILKLKGEVEEGVEQRVALLIAPAEDTFDPVRIDVERLSTGERTSADQGVVNIRRLLLFNHRSLGDPGLVAAAKILMHSAEPLDPLSEGQRRGFRKI